MCPIGVTDGVHSEYIRLGSILKEYDMSNE